MDRPDEKGASVVGIGRTHKMQQLLMLVRPVKTYDTACVYYHKFRLFHGDNEYAFVVSDPDMSTTTLILVCRSSSMIANVDFVLRTLQQLRYSQPARSKIHSRSRATYSALPTMLELPRALTISPPMILHLTPLHAL